MILFFWWLARLAGNGPMIRSLLRAIHYDVIHSLTVIIIV